MKSKITACLLLLSLSALTVPLTSCSTTGDGGAAYAPTPASVRSAVALLTYQKLSEAKTVAKYNSQAALASQIANGLTILTSDGLTVQSVVTALSAQFGTSPEVLLYVEVATSLLPPTFPTLVVRNEYLSAVADGIIRGIGLTKPPV